MFFGKRFHGHQGSGLSGLDILVLSIIKNNPKISGYEISLKINNNFRGMWKASAGTIYPLLNRLAEKGYLDVEETVDNNRQKKLYSVSSQGLEKVKDMIEINLRNSIDTLGEYMKTVLKAVPTSLSVDDCFCGWPSRETHQESTLDEENYSLDNIERLQTAIQRLKVAKERYSKRIAHLESQIISYEKLLDKLKKGREEKARRIEILDEDADFEDFN
ncbi:MAG: PadR family transcriptional regulator [Candidatus Lokiarchaeota archaeon]|nr:PadR family transcriptional regulator [Candidatus Lokiarchaeota archaeon]